MKVAEFLRQRGIEFQIMPHEVAYGAQHVAQALHVSGQQVVKTVLLRADHRFSYMVAVLPAAKHINLTLLSKDLCGCEVELATEAEIAEHCPDCEFGILSPFGSQYAMKTVVDKSLANASEIVFEGNTHQEAIRMKFDDYIRVEEPLILTFSRD